MDLKFVEELAEIAESRWSACDHDQEAFPEIAAAALREVGAHDTVGALQLFRAILAPWKTPRYHSRHPSPGIVTLFSDPRFQILAHFWVDDIGSPHQHGWAGAYQVIEGSSLQAIFDFEEHRRVRSNFHLGEMRTRHLEYLKAGDVVEVPSGRRMIHSIIHVERPSVSISLRTTDRASLTLDYARPGVAFESASIDADTQDRLRCLDVLWRAGADFRNRTLAEFVREHDLVAAFYALRQVALRQQIIPDEVFAQARLRHGESFTVVERSIEDFHRTAKFQSLRHNIEDEDLRFFLGTLYLARNRTDVLNLIYLRHEEGLAGSLMGRWLAQLLIEDETGAQTDIPTAISQALGCLAMGTRLDTVLTEMARTTPGKELDFQTNFLHQASSALNGALVYQALFADLPLASKGVAR